MSVLAGLWQYGTWNSDRAAASRDLVHAAPVPLGSLMSAESAFPGRSVGQPVTFEGRWVPGSTMYVSGVPHQGKRGYWAVTPVMVDKSAIPVVRGWTPTPTAPSPTGQVHVTGWLEPSQSQGEADLNPHDDIITSMRIPSMTQHSDVNLYSAYVVARATTPTSSADAALAAVGPTQQPDVSGFTGLRNLLYALQWWVFGILAIYIWWRWCQEQLHPHESDPADRSAMDAQVPSGP